MDLFVQGQSLTFAHLLAETERRLLTSTAMMGIIFLMTAVSCVLLRLTMFAILQSTLINVTFVETLEECLPKYVMMGINSMGMGVLQIVFPFSRLGFAQEETALQTMFVYHYMETGLLLVTSNAMTITLLTMTVALL